MMHELKICPEYFSALVAGEKPFELRKDDRGYQVGDHLVLYEYDPGHKAHCNGIAHRLVTYILRDCPGLAPGYVVLGVAPLPNIPDYIGGGAG